MEVEEQSGGNRYPLALCMGIGAIALGYALQINNGSLHPKSIFFLTFALLLTFISITVPSISALRKYGDQPVLFVVGLGLAFQLGQLLITPPGIYIRLSTMPAFAPYFLGLIAAIVLAATLLWAIPWLDKARVPLLISIYLIMGVWLIKASPNPSIDVYVFQKESVSAFLSGTNPYSMTYPDIYNADSGFYGPGLSVNGRLDFGFPYPPLSLLLAIPGYIFAGDYRYSQLIAMGLSALFMAYARPGKLAAATAALFLFTPRTFFVLEQGWTEPYIVMLLAATVFLACRRPRWVPLTFGLLLAVKQYMAFALPLIFLIQFQPLPFFKQIYKQLTAIAAVVLLVSLPLAVWNLPAFWKDVIALQVVQPFRGDALSYLAWFYHGGTVQLPTTLAFLAAFLAISLALLYAPRTPAGFAAGMALVYLSFFAFNKQAFCNYYYFVIGAMCCSISVINGHSSPLISEAKMLDG